MQLLEETLAISEKETDLALRYKIPFFTSSLISPLIRIMPFLLVYGGFFAAGANLSLGAHLKPETFIPFLFLGITTDIFFNTGYSTFAGKFQTEKWWQTIEIIFLAPINRMSIITGVGLGELIAVLPTLVLFIGLAYFFIPIPFLDLLKVLVIMLLTLLISLSMGLVVGSANLVNENLGPIFGYLRIFLVFLSAFYYPIEVLKTDKFGPLGEFIPVLATFNPIYQANFAIRSIWFEGVTPLTSIIYILFFAIISPIAAVYFFNKIWSALGIQGY